MLKAPESKGGGAKIRLTTICRRHRLRLPAGRTKISVSPLELEGLGEEYEGLGVDLHAGVRLK